MQLKSRHLCLGSMAALVRGSSWGWVVDTVSDPPSPPSHHPSIPGPGESPSSGKTDFLPALLASRAPSAFPLLPSCLPPGWDGGRSPEKPVSFPPFCPPGSQPSAPGSSPSQPLSAPGSDLQMPSLLSVLLTLGWQCRLARLPWGQLRPALLPLKSPHVLKLIKTNTAHIFVLNPILRWAGVGEGG